MTSAASINMVVQGNKSVPTCHLPTAYYGLYVVSSPTSVAVCCRHERPQHANLGWRSLWRETARRKHGLQDARSDVHVC
jgi:hypothetical protein